MKYTKRSLNDSTAHAWLGSSFEAFALAHTNGTVDSSCIPYAAYNQPCTLHNTCRQNLNGTPPVATKTVAPLRYFVGEYGVVGTSEASATEKEAAMMKEIYARGPVAAVAQDRASSNFMGLTSLGLEIGIFCDFLYNVLL